MAISHSHSAAETKRFGEKLARALRKGSSKTHATVIALSGEIGAGKTTFVQGFLRGLGIKKRTVSPTFVIMRRFRIPPSLVKNHRSTVKYLYHADAYRLKKAEELAPLAFDDILRDPRNIVLIEWPERIRQILPRARKTIRFHHGRKEYERTIRV